MSAIERLLERLQTGWAPKTDEIDREVPQRDLIKWEFAPSFSRPTAVVIHHRSFSHSQRRDIVDRPIPDLGAVR